MEGRRSRQTPGSLPCPLPIIPPPGAGGPWAGPAGVATNTTLGEAGQSGVCTGGLKAAGSHIQGHRAAAGDKLWKRSLAREVGIYLDMQKTVGKTLLSDKVNISSGVSINSILPLQIFLGSTLGLKVAFSDFLALISILNVKLLESTDSNNLECCFSDLSEQHKPK